LVHPELAAERGCAPVDAPQTVARLPLPKVGELDAFATGPRDLVAGEDLRLERRDERYERLLAREDAQRARLAGAALPRPEAEHVAGAEEQRADRERSPPVAEKLQLDRAFLTRAQVDRPRCTSLDAQLR